MAVKTTAPTAADVAWRRFQKVARSYRDAAGDDELRALLIERTRTAFAAWTAAEEEAAAK